MYNIDTTYLERCIATLTKAYLLLQQANSENIDYDRYRSACIKAYEIIIEQCGKLLRKVLKSYIHSSREVDQLNFKDVFRQAVLRSLISVDDCERWLQYRDYRNNTAHDYGVNFAEETLLLLPSFIADASALAVVIKAQNLE